MYVILELNMRVFCALNMWPVAPFGHLNGFSELHRRSLCLEGRKFDEVGQCSLLVLFFHSFCDFEDRLSRGDKRLYRGFCLLAGLAKRQSRNATVFCVWIEILFSFTKNSSCFQRKYMVCIFMPREWSNRSNGVTLSSLWREKQTRPRPPLQFSTDFFFFSNSCTTQPQHILLSTFIHHVWYTRRNQAQRKGKATCKYICKQEKSVLYRTGRFTHS